MTQKPPSPSAAPSKVPLLTRAGQQLFGPHHWHMHLAKALGVSRRAILRWETGKDSPTPQRWRDLETFVREQHAELAHLLRELTKKNRA